MSGKSTAKPLTAEHLAIVCALRDKGASLRECGLAIHREWRVVKDALDAEGYDSRRYVRARDTPTPCWMTASSIAGMAARIEPMLGM